jgi:superfamily II DNA or RNA helicase
VENTARYIPEASLYHASSNKKEFGQITIACWQSIVSTRNIPDFDLLILDEAHRYDLQHNFFLRIRYKKLIEFTATPLGKIKPTFYRSLREMTPEYLVPIVYGGKDLINLDGIKFNNGDYRPNDLEERYKSINEKIIEDVKRKTSDRKFIVLLCSTISHADEVAALCGAWVCHSKKDERLEFEASGGILCTVMMVSEGYDFPAIDCIAFLRATKSEVLYTQAVGRGLRPHTGKSDLLVLDYGRVLQNLGDVYDIDFSQLEKKRPTVRLCPMCENMTKKTTCECGFEFYIEKRESCERSINLTEESGDLWVNLFKVEALRYTSKAGSKCVKLVFYSDLFTVAATSYYTGWSLTKLLRDVDVESESDLLENKSYERIKKIKVVKNGKYRNAKEYLVI